MLSPDGINGGAPGGDVHAAAATGISGSGGALPQQAKIQQSFGGYDISNVTAHTDSAAARGAAAMGADAYATGNHVVLGKGGDSLHTQAHEAAHVIQQRAGVSLSGGVGKSGDAYEQHADRVADAVVQGKSAEGLLGEMAGGGGQTSVQRRETESSGSPVDDLLAVAERFVQWDPATMRVIGEIVGVRAEPPGHEFVAALEVWQATNGGKPTGALDTRTVNALSETRKNDLKTQAKEEGRSPRELEATCPLLSRTNRPEGNGLSTDTGGRTGDTGYGSKPLLVHRSFLGQPIIDGVHLYLADKLAAAETHLKAELGAVLSDGEGRAALEQNGIVDASAATLGKVLGIVQPHTGWRGGEFQGYHRYGLAIDINRDRNAWHPVRTGTMMGGEGTFGKTKASVDKEALVIIDRANIFMRKVRAEVQAVPLGLADRPGAAEEVALKSGNASRAVADYFQLVFEGDAALLAWDPRSRDSVKLPANLNELSEAKALANIETVIERVHGGTWSRSATAMRDQIRRDLFPLARQMSVGAISNAPKETKNPLNGFFNIDGRLAAALTRQAGLVWGACEFGYQASGDAMHFDTGTVPSEALGRKTPPRTASSGGTP